MDETRLNLLAEPWRTRVRTAAVWLEDRGFAGKVGLILGSGLGNFTAALEGARSAAYAEIPGFRTTTVAEHSGKFVCGSAAGVPVLVMQGRLHPYEGLSFDELLLPTAVLAGLGPQSVVVTNAAGGLNRFFVPGDLMVIRDQVDLHLRDPLRGLLSEGSSAAGRRGFPGPLFSPDLALALEEAGAAVGVALRTGTYASMWGPAYETKAEIGMLRRLDCDAVGMSTATETVLLRRLGVAVAGISCITNPARETGQPELSHADVVAVGKMVRERISRLLLAFLPRAA